MVGCTYRMLPVLCWALFMVTQARRLEVNRTAVASLDGPISQVNTNPEISEGLYEGDIVLTQEQKLLLHQRKAINSATSFWPKDSKGIVTVGYRFGDVTINKKLVKDALSHWEKNTCVSFKEVSPTVGYVHLKFVDAINCASSVGRDPKMTTGQTISLYKTCLTENGKAVHEIGHALGFFHEQSRTGREKHVTVMTDNIINKKMLNFAKESTNNYNVPYDYWSVMQYGPYYFTNNGRNTLAALNPIAQPLMGNRIGLSFMDKLTANTMYGCIGKWLTKCSLSTNPCKNMGYTGPACSCVCPEGTSGSRCENLQASNTDALIKLKTPYSGTINKPGKVSTPGYPTPIRKLTKFAKVLVAPKCYKVRLIVKEFAMHPRNTDRICPIEALSIRIKDAVGTGEPYCGKEIAPGKMFISGKNTIVLDYYNLGDSGSTYRGFSATVEHIPVPGCKARKDSGPSYVLPSSTTSLESPSIAKTLGKSFELGLQVQNSDCHEIIKMDAGDTGYLIKGNYLANTICEWWFQAPSGRKIELAFSAFNVGTSDCAGDFLGIDTSGDRLYKSASKKYCATNSPENVTSSGEQMNVLLKGIQGGYPGFIATYSVV